MRIIVASMGRAHLLDCARELQSKGHEVTFYAATPKHNFERYGLKHGGKSLLKYALPFWALQHFFPSNVTRRIYSYVLDVCVCHSMHQCDIFIAQSPNFQNAILKAKRKYRAITILDRGSSHVRTFNRLSQENGIRIHTESYMKRDENEYNTVDYIAIASDFVYNSFLEHRFDKNKLFVNPYGVSLTHFYPTICTNQYDCILVGSWGRRKGHHLIVEAFLHTKIRILHVGSLKGDLEFPLCDNFTHLDAVPESELVNYYKQAKVFLFPSIDDGFGLVLCQAAACGLPIVCSMNSGGPTLKRMIDDKEYIYLMKELSVTELKQGVEHSLKIAEKFQGNPRNYVHHQMKKFTWQAYGERYSDFLKHIAESGR